jgi:hypothetical protein
MGFNSKHHIKTYKKSKINLWILTSQWHMQKRLKNDFRDNYRKQQKMHWYQLKAIIFQLRTKDFKRMLLPIKKMLSCLERPLMKQTKQY